MLTDEHGVWMRGDTLGLLCAQALGVDVIVTPVSSNTAAELSNVAGKVIRTRIGSPHVIAAMDDAAGPPGNKVVGYEANGGFLLGSDVEIGGRTLRRLPTIIRKRRNPKLGRKWKGLVSIDRGLGGLCDAIADEIGAGVWKSTRVTCIERTGDNWQLDIDRDGNTERLACSDVVLTTPAHETARLLAGLTPQVAEELRAVESSSLTVVNLGFRKSDVAHPLDGFGFLVPHNEPDFPLMGTLFADSAFPHHAPADCRLLRVFFGGTRTPDVLSRSADELVRTARSALGDVLGVRGEPVLIDVCPYPNAIPQYYLDHPQRVARIRAGVTPLTGLHLAGNYLDGVSINDCVKLGKQVAIDVQARVPQTA